jgi:hypothetical protein
MILKLVGISENGVDNWQYEKEDFFIFHSRTGNCCFFCVFNAQVNIDFTFVFSMR